MADFFGRKVRVTISGLKVENLRIGFTIERNLRKEPNTAQVTVYNLNEGHRRQITNLETGKRIPVTLEAGYESSAMSVLFDGDLRYAYSEPIGGGTWTTTISSGDGDRAYKSARTQRTARAGVSMDRLAQEVADDFGVGVGNIRKALATSRTIEDIGDAFGEGANFKGRASKVLTRILRSAGLGVSVQNNELQALPLSAPAPGTAIVLRPWLGELIGVPVIDTKGRCEFKSLLRPDLVPGGVVSIQDSVVANGTWKLQSVRYVGDTHGRDFTAECEGVRHG